jgi:hypothetical protein
MSLQLTCLNVPCAVQYVSMLCVHVHAQFHNFTLFVFTVYLGKQPPSCSKFKTKHKVGSLYDLYVYYTYLGLWRGAGGCAMWGEGGWPESKARSCSFCGLSVADSQCRQLSLRPPRGKTPECALPPPPHMHIVPDCKPDLCSIIYYFFFKQLGKQFRRLVRTFCHLFCFILCVKGTWQWSSFSWRLHFLILAACLQKLAAFNATGR